jgi:transposase
MQATYCSTARQGRGNSPLVDELSAIYEALDDSKLMKRLWSYRWTGRRGYSPRSLWWAVIAGYFLNIGTSIGLVRRLQEDKELSDLCGFFRVPSRITVGRFLRRLAENMELVEQCFTATTKEIAKRLEGFGRELAVDSTTVPTYANPGREIKSDPDATWTRKPNSQRKLTWYYGYRLHLVCDANYELPVHAEVKTANLNDSPTLVPLATAAVQRLGSEPAIISADAGYDSNANVEGILTLGARPVIKRVARRTTTGRWQKPHPRLEIDQGSPEWLRAYARRVSVERVFARLKSHRSLARHCRRRLLPVALHCLLAVLTMQAAALAHIIHGDFVRMRECARGVA